MWERTNRVKTIIQYSLHVFYIKFSTVKLNNILLNEDFNLGTQSTFWCKNKMTTIGLKKIIIMIIYKIILPILLEIVERLPKFDVDDNDVGDYDNDDRAHGFRGMTSVPADGQTANDRRRWTAREI